jgi:putative CocE/NonD family hydrolase
LSLPILTITGSYDDDQPGAIQHYRQFMQYASAEARERHYLVIGPWDHAGTHAANAQVGGLTFGPASLLDIAKLHVDWYAWTMSGGPKPDFLKQHVAYYVMGAEQWQYAPSLDAVTRKQRRLYLDSDGDATDVFRSGSLSESLRDGRADSYVYDPRDTAIAALEEKLDPSSLTDQSLTLANKGKLLVYHSEPFAQDTEVSGFFSLSAWISLDQPDTDFSVAIYEIRADGSAVLLTRDIQRARYREGPRRSLLINTREPLKYQFDGFTFVSRRVARGSRLRLVVAPVNSIYAQKNHNSGKAVANESADDSRPVTVQLFHDAAHPSVLRVPIGG